MPRIGPAAGLTAALLTKMSMPPYVCTAKSTSRCSCAASPTWQAMPATSSPSRRSAPTASSTFCCLRDDTTTLAPCTRGWQLCPRLEE